MESEASIQLSPEDRARLEGWVAGRNTPQKPVWRARIVLMWSQGARILAIVGATGKTKRTAYRWRDRCLARGVAGLERDATRPGRKPPLTAAAIERVVNMTLNEKPPAGAHWSARKLAKAVGLSHSSVQRIWAAWAEAACDAQLQALQRSPVLREGPGHRRALPRPAGQGAGALGRREEPNPAARPHPAGIAAEKGPRRNHDARLQATRHDHPLRRPRRRHRQGHRRVHAAASSIGSSCASCAPSTATPPNRSISTWLSTTTPPASTPRSRPALRRHPHFTPTSASWINLVERFFGLITEDAIRRGVFHQRGRTRDRDRVHLEQHNAGPDRPGSRHPRKSRQRTTSVRVGTLATLACPQSRAPPGCGSVGKLEVIRFDRRRTDTRLVH